MLTTKVSAELLAAMRVSMDLIGRALADLPGSGNQAIQLAMLQTAILSLSKAMVAAPMAAPPPRPIGINLNVGAFQYIGTAHPWLNRAKAGDSSGPVWFASVWSGTAPPVEADARGYPLAIPRGAHEIGFYFPTDGTASPIKQRYVVITNKRDVSFNVDNPVPSLSRKGFLVFDPNQINRSDPAWDMAVFHINEQRSPWKPDETLAIVRYDQVEAFKAGELYDPDYLAKISRFGAIRFMDWLHTNASPFARFSDLPPPDAASFTKAVPVAACCAYANRLGVDAELPVPHLFDDASVDQYVVEIRDTLKGRYSCALSNEAGWQFNAAFAQGGWFNDRSKDARFRAALGNDANPLSFYGYRSAQVMQRAIKAFAGQRQRLITNLGFQLVQPGTLYYRKQGALLAMRELGMSARTLHDCGFDAGQITWYFGLPSENDVDRARIVAWAKGGAAGLDAAFKALMDGTGLTTTVTYRSIADLAKMFLEWNRVLAAEGMRLEGYEGGHAMALEQYRAEDQPFVWDLRHRMRNDDRMSDAYGAIWAAWTRAGGGRAYQFTDFASEKNMAGDWSVWQKVTDPENPISRKLAALNGVTVA